MEIQDFPNYLIYDDGRVFSKKINKFMKHSLNSDGYKYVALYPHRKNFTIHRLIAKHFIPNPDNKPCVDHINRIRDDNRIENLRWATYSENNKNATNVIRNDNTTGFKWICDYKRQNCYRFRRKNCKERKSENISKLLCYSFFYLLKHPINS